MSELTQLESARRGIVTSAMRRVAERELVTAELVRDEVARGRMVIPANKHQLAGSGGRSPSGNVPRDFETAAKPHERRWVDQTVVERSAAIDRDDRLRGEHAPKRLDPMGIGRMISTKVNANIGASP